MSTPQNFQDVAAERAVLGSVLMDNGVLANVQEIISADDFSVPAHADVFRAIVSLDARQEKIDPLWKRVFGGCHLSRPVTSAIEHAGFNATPVGRRYMKGKPSIASWLEWGVAIKP